MQQTSQEPGSGDSTISSIAPKSNELAEITVNAAELERANACLARWENQAQHLTTAISTGELRWRLWGQGPPLVLVHGGAGAWSHWIRNLDALSSKYRVIAPDIPGLGDSSSPTSPYTPESIAELLTEGLLEILDRQACPSDVEIRIVGFSFGGMIAGLVAARLEAARPNRIKRLVLIGASGLGGRFADLEAVAKLPAMDDSSALRAVHFHNLRVMMLHDPRHIDELALLVQAINAPKTRVLEPQRSALASSGERTSQDTCAFA